MGKSLCLVFLTHGVVAIKIRFSCQSIRKNWYFYIKICILEKLQSPLEKLVVTSHRRHIQSCAYVLTGRVEMSRRATWRAQCACAQETDQTCDWTSERWTERAASVNSATERLQSARQWTLQRTDICTHAYTVQLTTRSLLSQLQCSYVQCLF